MNLKANRSAKAAMKKVANYHNVSQVVQTEIQACIDAAYATTDPAARAKW